MGTTIWKGLETFLIGLAVVIVGALIEALTNYHPGGIAAQIWAVVSVAAIGGLRALLSFLIVRQGTGEPPKPLIPPSVPK